MEAMHCTAREVGLFGEPQNASLVIFFRDIAGRGGKHFDQLGQNMLYIPEPETPPPLPRDLQVNFWLALQSCTIVAKCHCRMYRQPFARPDGFVLKLLIEGGCWIEVPSFKPQSFCVFQACFPCV